MSVFGDVFGMYISEKGNWALLVDAANEYVSQNRGVISQNLSDHGYGDEHRGKESVAL